MSNYMNMSGFSPREAASMIFKFWKSCHRCLNAPLQKIISCPRPDYSDLVGLLHTYYLSCPFIYIHKRNRIIHTPITSLFKNFIVTLAYSSSLLIFIVFPETTQLSLILMSLRINNALPFSFICFSLI